MLAVLTTPGNTITVVLGAVVRVAAVHLAGTGEDLRVTRRVASLPLRPSPMTHDAVPGREAEVAAEMGRGRWVAGTEIRLRARTVAAALSTR